MGCGVEQVWTLIFRLRQIYFHAIWNWSQHTKDGQRTLGDIGQYLRVFAPRSASRIGQSWRIDTRSFDETQQYKKFDRFDFAPGVTHRMWKMASSAISGDFTFCIGEVIVVRLLTLENTLAWHIKFQVPTYDSLLMWHCIIGWTGRGWRIQYTVSKLKAANLWAFHFLGE